jgi:FKBP-type peptidyl-prolyl cis-trans isomerase 2
MVITGFEQAVVGMTLGEKKTVSIPQENAYGPHLPELVSNIKKTEFPVHIQPELGQQLEISQPDAASFIVTITHIHEDEITLDANHPLAGKDLVFEIELLEITPSQPS